MDVIVPEIGGRRPSQYFKLGASLLIPQQRGQVAPKLMGALYSAGSILFLCLSHLELGDTKFNKKIK